MDVGKFISYLKSNELKRVEGGYSHSLYNINITLVVHVKEC